MLVAGSSQFAVNQGIHYGLHRDLFMNSVNYLLRDENFIAIRPAADQESRLSVQSASSVFVLAGLCFAGFRCSGRRSLWLFAVHGSWFFIFAHTFKLRMTHVALLCPFAKTHFAHQFGLDPVHRCVRFRLNRKR